MLNKIAFVFPPMWTPHSDGSLQIWNHEVTTRLSKHCDVLVYSGLFDFKRHDTVDGVTYRRFSTRLDNRFLRRFEYIHRALGGKRPLFSRDLWYSAYACKVAADLRQQGCQVVHIYNYPQFARIIKRFNPKLRVVLNMHGEWLTQVAFTNLHARLRTVDLIVSCSNFITKATATKFPDIANRCRTVPMGVSPDVFSHPQHSRGRDNARPPRLLNVGRISPEKGVHVLLEAFELIHREYSEATLTIVGPEWIAPREQIADLSLDKSLVASLAPYYENDYLSHLKQRLSPGAAKQVIFKGLVAHSEISKYYAAADVYISPSLYESFGMSVLEALAAGVPVVATRVGGAPELISHEESGLLVDIADPRAVAAAVLRLLADDRLRTSESRVARNEVSWRFSWENICSALLQAYGSLIDTESAEAGYVLEFDRQS